MLLPEPERERPLAVPPREPAAERRADVRAAFAPERAPVAAALVARRAPDAALLAVLRAEVPLVRLDEEPRERELVDELRELVELRERELLEELRERDDDVLRARLRLERRRPPSARWSRGISAFATSLTSCGIRRSR